MDEPAEPRPSLGQRIYRVLFRFLGPAQLGSFDQPETRKPDPEFRCPACGQPMSAHTYFQTPERRRMQCPRPPVPAP